MTLKSYVPNALTLLNLFSGLVALIFVINHDFTNAFYAVCLGIFFDFFDGFAARALKVQSKLGVELDSLADAVTSGVVPGLVMFYLMMKSLGIEISYYAQGFTNEYINYLPFVGFVITLGSVYRLAKFNIDERQTDMFIGLPTPANCLFIVGIALLIIQNEYVFISEWFLNIWILLAISITSAYLMNSEIYLFSLKIKKLSLKANFIPIFYLSTCILLIIMFKLLIVSFLIFFYVLLSLIVQRLIKTT